MSATRARRLLPAIAAIVTAAACGGGGGGGGDAKGNADKGTPVQGGTAAISVLADFQSFNPVTNTHLTSDDVVKHMLFTPLIQYDAKLKPVPWLAERWELTDTSVTFHLRRDVRWHDGPSVTANDVKFTFDLAKDPATASLLGSAYMNLVKSATVVDSFTVRFGFQSPHAQALDGFWWPPLPQHLLKGVDPAQLTQHAFNRQPVGTPLSRCSGRGGHQKPSRACACGDSKPKRTVNESTTVADLTRFMYAEPSSDAVAGSLARSKVNLTSLAVTGWPSCHLTSRRR